MEQPSYKIYACTHKDPKDRLPKDNSHYEVITTEDVKNGENLGDIEKVYAEGSHIYYIWKNLELPDWVGTCQYRKWWDDKIPDLNRTDFDIVVPTPYKWVGINNYEQYCENLNNMDIDIVEMIIHKKFPEYDDAVKKFNESNIFYPFNMFIMKKDMFKQYCYFAFFVLKVYDMVMNFKSSDDVVKHVKENINSYKKKPATDLDLFSLARTEGHLLERLTNVFIYHNCKKVYRIKLKLYDYDADELAKHETPKLNLK